MASGTVEKVVAQLNNSLEVVRLNVSDTNTYVSRKFSTIDAVFVTLNGAEITSGTTVSATWSGKTVTFNNKDLSKQDVSVQIWGE